MHGIVKKKDAPEINWEKMSDNEEIIKNVMYYLDSLIIIINSGLDVSSSDHHPYQKYLEDLNDDTADYIKLINKL